MARTWQDHKLQLGSLCILMIEKTVKAILSIIEAETAALELEKYSLINQYANTGRITDADRRKGEELQQKLTTFLREGRAGDDEEKALEALWKLIETTVRADIVNRTEFMSVIGRMMLYRKRLRIRPLHGGVSFAYMSRPRD